MEDTQFIVIYSTCPNIQNGRQIAKSLLTHNKVACVNIIPKIESMYWWNEKIEIDSECLLIIKSTKNKFDEVKELIEKNHEYEVPEIISLPIIKGSDKYLKWILENVK